MVLSKMLPISLDRNANMDRYKNEGHVAVVVNAGFVKGKSPSVTRFFIRRREELRRYAPILC